MRNRIVLAIAAIIALVIIAFAIAVASDDHDDSAAAPTATPPVQSTPRPTQPPATLAPTQRPDQPISATPGPTQPIAPRPTTTEIPLARHPEVAPIDGLDVLTLETFPPQYVVHILAGLPSGCAQPLSHQVVGRQGNVIQVSVLNSLPDNAICTAIYGTYELSINLGSDFVSGQTYIVRVNNKEVSFMAR